MTFIDKLRDKKSNLKVSSQDTYIRNIKRLRRVKHSLPIPETESKWLVSKALFAWYDKQPLSVRRHMSNSANIALSVYGKENKEWKKDIVAVWKSLMSNVGKEN